jgi:hypothetical protein
MLSGSATSNQTRNRFGYFHNSDVKVRRLSAKDFAGALIRIMPSRNYALGMHDAQFAESVMPYRDVTRLDAHGRPEFSYWSVEGVSVFPYVGRSGESIVSRRTLAAAEGGADRVETADPLCDLMKYCKDNKLEQFTEQNGKKSALLSWPDSPAFLTVQVASRQNPVPTMLVTMLSSSSIDDGLKAALNIYASPPMLPARQPELWPQYAFGDITSPGHDALYVWAEKRPIGSREVWALALNQGKDMNVPATFANQPTPQLTPAELLQRPNLRDLNLWNIPTYQAVVDWILEDGFLPAELVRVACGHSANISAIAGAAHAGAPTSVPVTMGHGGPAWAPAPAGFPGAPAPAGFPAAPAGFPAPPQFPGAQPQLPGAPAAPQFPAAPAGFPGAQPQFPGAPAAPQFPAASAGFPAPPQFPGAQPQFPAAPAGFPAPPQFPGAQPQFPAAPAGFPAPQFPGAPAAPQFPGAPAYQPMAVSPPAAAGFAGAPPPMPPAPPAGTSFAAMEAAARQEPLVVTPTTAPERGYWVSLGGVVAAQPVMESDLGAFLPTVGPDTRLKDALDPNSVWLTKDELAAHLSAAAPAPFTAAPAAAAVSGPLSAAEVQQLQDLQHRLETNPASLGQQDYGLFAELSARARTQPAG